MLWLFVFALLLQGPFLATVDEGSGLDPHGRPVRVTSDLGARIDDNGYQSAACGDDGTGIDPHGAPCSLTATTDEGNGLDPHGRP